MNRVLKVALLGGLAVSLASCGTVRNALPFGLGGSKEPQATATAGQRISVLEFEQQLAPSAALSGRDFFLPGPQAATAWSQPGGNADNSVEHVIAAPGFTVAWRRGVGAGSSRTRQVMAPVVADNGRVFVLDGEATVSALDSGTGAQAWKVNIRPDEREGGRRGFFGIGGTGGTTGGGFGGGVAVGGGKVFVSSGYRIVTALDQATGAVLWTTPVDVPIHGAPTVSGSRVFVVDVENQIQAFDTTTGAQDWSYRGIPEPARIMRASSPAVTGDTVVAPFSSGEVVALRAATGQSVWQQVLSRTSRTSALSEIRDIAGRPVISRGVVYAISHSGLLSALDIRTGQPKWSPLPIAGVNAPLPVGDVDTLCPSCQLNRTIPDLASAANHEPWHKLEIAKRRILYTLARLGLSPLNKKQDAVSGLAFDFLRPNPGGLVLTGHEDGVITLNVEEAEDLERGKRRVLLGESYRTLVGHFRHEIAHYYWDRFFIGRTDGDVGMQGFREGFGDERDDYNLALQRHYTAGPVAA